MARDVTIAFVALGCSLVALGCLKKGEPLTEDVRRNFIHAESFEERERLGLVVDPGVLQRLRERL